MGRLNFKYIIMDTIVMTCECCNNQIKVERTKEIPSMAVEGWSNYCNKCGENKDYYEETFYDEKGNLCELYT